MTRESLLNEDWTKTVAQLGGAEVLKTTARETRAFLRGRGIATAVDLLRLILAYCLSGRGLRSTAAWAAAVGLADISNVAMLNRLRGCGDWLAMLVGRLLAVRAPEVSRGRLIRIIDATTVAKASGGRGELWRIHCAFDLPQERFSYFELTDEHQGETLDRIPPIEGELRIADRAYLQPSRMAALLAGGADFVIRAGWKNARWLDNEGCPIDLIDELRAAGPREVIDRPISIGRTEGKPLALRLVALKKPPQAAAEARRKAREDAQRKGRQLSEKSLDAADWLILVTSLKPEEFAAVDILALYRLRWRIELAFKRLKSLVGLRAPPGVDERSAKPYILAHLLMVLLLEPLVDELEDSPRWATAA
jgi:DDE family transposase